MHYEKKFYRKPELICQFDPRWEKITENKDVEKFIREKMEEIQKLVKELDLTIGLATFDDIEEIKKFDASRFSVIGVEQPSGFYEIYRIITFGNVAVVKNRDGEILGCLKEIGYDTPERTSCQLTAGVHPSLSGKRIGIYLIEYLFLLAMKRGSRFIRAVVSPINFPSVKNFLNYMGFLFDGYYDNLPGYGTRFTMCAQIAPAAMLNNRIDMEKTLKFIENNRENHDFALVPCEEPTEIARLYRETDFQIVAFLPKGSFANMHQYLALPKEKLRFPE